MLQRPLALLAASMLLLSLSTSITTPTRTPQWRDGVTVDPVDGHLLRLSIAGSVPSGQTPARGSDKQVTAAVGSAIIDPALRYTPRETELYGRGGVTGALTAVETLDGPSTTPMDADLQWTRTDGTIVELGPARMATFDESTVAAADVMATIGGVGQHAKDWVDLKDLHTGVTDRVLLNGLIPVKTIARTVIATFNGDLTYQNNALPVHLLRNEGGVLSDVVIPTPPCKVDRLGDGDGQAVIAFCDNRTVGLIDLQTGTFTSVSQQSQWASPDGSRLTPTHVIWKEYAGGTLAWAPRSGGPATSPAIGSAQYPLLGMSGQWLVTGNADHQWGFSSLTAISAAGGPVRTLLDAPMWLAQLPDGTLLAAAGQTPNQGIFRIAPGADGAPVVTLIRSIPQAHAPTMAISVSGRRLTTVDKSVSTNWVGDRTLGVSGPIVAGPRRTLGSNAYEDFCNVPCAHIASTGSTTVYSNSQNLIVVDARGRARTIPIGGPYQPYGFVMTDTYLAHPSGGRLVDLRTGADIAAPGTPLALWGNTLWVPRADFMTTGVILAKDLAKGTQASFTTAGRCHVNTISLQAVGRWMAWSCGPLEHGVVDTMTGQHIALPDGVNGVLGDGFIVFQQGLLLSRLNLTAPSPATGVAYLDLAMLNPNVGTRWDVDRYGGQVLVWSDATHRLHVEPLPIPATTPLTLLHADVPATFSGAWKPTWAMSKPSNWTLTLRSGGATVKTLTGQSYGTAVIPDWDGSAALTGQRRPGPAGFSWTLTIAPADGVGAPVTLTGNIAQSPRPLPPRRISPLV